MIYHIGFKKKKRNKKKGIIEIDRAVTCHSCVLTLLGYAAHLCIMMHVSVGFTVLTKQKMLSILTYAISLYLPMMHWGNINLTPSI